MTTRDAAGSPVGHILDKGALHEKSYVLEFLLRPSLSGKNVYGYHRRRPGSLTNT